MHQAEKADAWHCVCVQVLAWIVGAEGALHALHCLCVQPGRCVLCPHVACGCDRRGRVDYVCWLRRRPACVLLAAVEGSAQPCDCRTMLRVHHLHAFPKFLSLLAHEGIEIFSILVRVYAKSAMLAMPVEVSACCSATCIAESRAVSPSKESTSTAPSMVLLKGWNSPKLEMRKNCVQQHKDATRAMQSQQGHLKSSKLTWARESEARPR